MNDTLTDLKIIIGSILDIDPNTLRRDIYVIRDLGVESIDLLELAVKINSTFAIEVNDDQIFLKKFRSNLTECVRQNDTDPALTLSRKYPQLTIERIREVIEDLTIEPALRISDIVNYIEWKQNAKL